MRVLSSSLFAASAYALGSVRYDGHQVVRVEPRSVDPATFFETVDRMGLDLFGHSPDGAVELRVSPEQMASLAESHWEYTVVDENLQERLDRLDEQVCRGTTQECLDGFYDQYQTLDVFHAKLDQLSDRFPVVSNMTIGTSYEGRDLKGVVVSSSHDREDDKMQIFYNCGIHSREWIPPFFCVYLADTLAQGYEEGDEAVTAVLEEFDIHLVPSANPDGFVHTHEVDPMWRKSRKPNQDGTTGTDLNRNFCHQWGTGGSSSVPSSNNFMGYECFDNPESQALADYTARVQPVAYMDIHARGYMWMLPLGHIPRSECLTEPRGCGVESDADYEHQMAAGDAAAKAAFEAEGGTFAVGPITWIIYQASGSTADHMYAELDVLYSYALEVRGNSHQPDPSEISPSNRELYAGVMAQLEYISANQAHVRGRMA